MDRDAACVRLGVPEDSIIVYVQLGAGNINDIDSEIGMTLEILNKYENTFVVLGESMIGDRLNVYGERIRIIRDYPNSRFLRHLILQLWLLDIIRFMKRFSSLYLLFSIRIWIRDRMIN